MAQKISVLRIDIAPLVFHVVGMDDTGHVVLRTRMASGELLHVIATLPEEEPCAERRRRTPHEAALREHQQPIAEGESNDVPGIKDVSEVDATAGDSGSRPAPPRRSNDKWAAPDRDWLIH